jgi:hypothetical protein
MTFGIRLVRIMLIGPHSLTIAISRGPPRVCAVPLLAVIIKACHNRGGGNASIPVPSVRLAP